MSEGEHRKLTAIMFTDLVGYSALAQRNEALALELLEEHRRILRPIFPRHHGREVETAGDAFLVEFASALEAVRCAVEIQEQLSERNRLSPPERAIRLRIGIHVGDVVHKDGKVMGDAVNIAARIEPLAPSGGICVSNAVFEQVRNKLEQGFASLGPAELKNIELPVAVHRVVMPWEDAGSTTLPKTRQRPQPAIWKFALPLTIVAIGLGLAVWQPWKKSAAPLTVEKPKLSEAQKLTQQARALIDDDPLAVRENYRLAEELGQRAVQLEPTDGEAWAVLARSSLHLVAGRYDDTPARRESSHSQAERAIRLAPESLEAGLAMAGYLFVSRQFAEVESRARELLRRFPDDQRAVLLLSESLERQNRLPEARDLLRQHTNTPAGLVSFLDVEAYDRFDQNELVEADVVLDQLFAAKPTANSYLTRLLVLWTGWGDLPAAAAFLEKIPSQFLQEDAFAHHSAYIWMELGQTEKALEALRRIPREFLEEKRVIRPKGLVTGRVLQAAGRTAAAEVEWRQALKLVEQRLAAEPGRADWVRLKALLLAHLGEKVEAQKQLQLWREMSGIPAGDESARSLEIHMVLGEPEEVIRGFQTVIPPRKGRWLNSLNTLRHDPIYAPIRSDARVQEMIAGGERWLQGLREAKALKAGTSTAAATGPDQKSIAVLAFANLSDDKANEYFSDGISEELLNVLAKIPGLKVTARTSSFSFRGKEVPIPEIARQLGVAYVVEGSVRKAGDKVRITAQLIKAADGFHVWSDTFTRDLKDVFAVQDEIAGLVAQNLSLKLGATSPKAAIDPEAFRLYLEGRKEWSLRTKASLAKAENLFTQAIALDPKFARAHSGLADVWMIRADGLERENQNADAEYVHTSEALDRALQLDPELAEAYATRGNYFVHKEQYTEAEQAFQRALALNPNYASAHQWYGRLLFTLGKLDAGLAELELATRLDPLSPIITSNYGMFLGFTRRWSESLVVCDRALAIQPDFEQALGMRAYALVYLNRRPEALGIVRATFKSLGTNAPADPNGSVWEIELLALAGDRANAERLAAPILAGAGRNSPAEVFTLFLALNRSDEAFTFLDRSKYRFKRSEIVHLLDPIYDPVRDDPRFLRKLDEAGYLTSYTDVWAQYLAWKKKSGQP